MGYIYALYSTDENVPRYIGLTKGQVWDRWVEHRYLAENGDQRPVYRWIRKKWLIGVAVAAIEIDRSDDPELLSDLEAVWISVCEGLKNGTKFAFDRLKTRPTFLSRLRRSRLFSQASITKLISKKNSHYVDNYHGYHGIRYWKELDAFTVAICCGSSESCYRRLVPGDELAGYSSWPYWFSDLVMAINARGKARAECDQQQWPRDHDGFMVG